MILTHHGINSLSRVAVGDCLYADANGKKHFVNPDAIPNPLPEGWEFVGVVALIDGNKATIIYKTENTSANWASMWLFKVNGLKLDGTDSFVLQQGAQASGSSPVEVGTFTATEAATDLDTLVSELDTWLRANPTETGALANYNWHAEKHEDADGVDSCFIVVDNIDARSQVSPIKSSTSGASSPLYMWNWCGFGTDYTGILRKDGVTTFAVVWNKERFKSYNTNVGSVSDSLTSPGLCNENTFNATTIIKEYYGTYDNYLDNMMPDENGDSGAYSEFIGKGKEISDAVKNLTFKDLSGTSTAVFASEAWAASLTAHSAALVEGLNAGDFIVPSIDTAYKILSMMKSDASDVVNSALVKAGLSSMSIARSRWALSRRSADGVWLFGSRGYFNSNDGTFLVAYSMANNLSTIAVAEITL